MARLLERYGEFIGKRPWTVIAIAVFLFIVSNVGSGLITESVTDFADQVPQDMESIQGFMFIEDEFRSTGTNIIFAIEIDPEYRDSEEARDVRDPEVMNYLDMLSKKSRTIPQVVTVTSAADVLKQLNNGRIPQSKNRITGLIDLSDDGIANPFSAYVSKDYSIAAVRINYVVSSLEDSDSIVRELMGIEKEVVPPRGVKTTLTGDPVTNIVLMEQIGPTFAITGMFSFIGILIVVVLIFYSFRYGVTSLLAIVFGSAWAFGLIGFIGFSLTSESSGSLSLIMGIGIDFGIQVVTRFRQELRKLDPRKAIAKTMPNVIPPMTIAAVAIFFGFQSLNFGNLQFIGDLGNVMSFGVIMSYLAAISVVPAVLVVLNTFSLKSLRRKR
jgi:predicted RND superfamily exporter protein